jgi:hypothetical protein
VFQKFAQVGAVGQVFAQVGEQQKRLALGQFIPHLAEQMGGGDIDGLHSLHIQNDEIACLYFRGKQSQQLLCGAEEEAALQFENDRLIAFVSRMRVSDSGRCQFDDIWFT